MANIPQKDGYCLNTKNLYDAYYHFADHTDKKDNTDTIILKYVLHIPDIIRVYKFDKVCMTVQFYIASCSNNDWSKMQGLYT